MTMVKITDTAQHHITTDGACNIVSVGFSSLKVQTLNNLKAQFEKLKLCALKLEFIPRVTKFQTQAIATGNATLVFPDIVTICEPNPDLVYDGFEAVRANPGHKKHTYGSRIVKYIKPMCTQDVTINGIPTTQFVRMPFLSSRDVTSSTAFGYLYMAHVAGQTLPSNYVFAQGMLYTLRKTWYICGKKYNPAGYTFAP